MGRAFFDPLMHIKVGASFYQTGKNAEASDIRAFYESGEIEGGVVACMPDDDPHIIGKIVETELPFCRMVVSVKPEWVAYSQAELSILFESLKRSWGVVGIKIHPRFSRIMLDDETTVGRIISAAHSSGLMVYVCTIFRAPSGPYATPAHYVIAQIADKHREGDIVFLHGGYTDLFSTGEVIRDYPHAWLDLSFTFMRFRKSSLVMDCGYLFETLDRKLMIGTDYPEHTPRELMKAIDHYILGRDDLDISEEKLDNIFSRNIKKLVNKYGSRD